MSITLSRSDNSLNSSRVPLLLCCEAVQLLLLKGEDIMDNCQCPIPRLSKFLIDTNLINARQKNAHMNYLEKMHEDGYIQLMMTKTSFEEASNIASRKNDWEEYYKEYCRRIANGTLDRAMKASGYIFTEVYWDKLSFDDQMILKRIVDILSIGSRGNITNDSQIVFCSYYYEIPLVTEDGDSATQIGILGHRAELLEEFGIQIFNAKEAALLVQKLIQDNMIAST